MANASFEVSRTNASISSGVGGSPIRSSVARRISVRFPAGRTGFKFCDSSLARMNLSMAPLELIALPQALSLTGGGSGLRTGWKAQKARCWGVIRYSGDFDLPAGGDSGQIAPSLTQVRRSAISESVSLPCGGILRRSCVWATACRSRLLSGSPGTIAGPDLPPFRKASRPLISRPPMRAPVWQEKQFFARSGRMRISKKSR